MFTPMEYIIPPKHVMKILCKFKPLSLPSEHGSKNVSGCFFSEHSVYTCCGCWQSSTRAQRNICDNLWLFYSLTDHRLSTFPPCTCTATTHDQSPLVPSIAGSAGELVPI